MKTSDVNPISTCPFDEMSSKNGVGGFGVHFGFFSSASFFLRSASRCSSENAASQSNELSFYSLAAFSSFFAFSLGASPLSSDMVASVASLCMVSS